MTDETAPPKFDRAARGSPPGPCFWAIVPAKSLRSGKSRLGDHVTVEIRERLNRFFLTRTLKLALAVERFSEVVVVSADPTALALAGDLGARPLLETGPSGLNQALAFAAKFALEAGADATMNIFADLPQLEVADLDAILDAGTRAIPGGPITVIGPDEANQGTNVLLTAPPGIIPYHYGENSFQAHCQAARAAGIEPCVVRRPGLLFDIDSPEDLARWRSQGGDANGMFDPQ